MAWLDSLINAGLGALLWPFFRISSMLMVMSTIGTRSTPSRVKLALAAAITLAIFPFLPDLPKHEMLSLAALLISAQQVLIGLAMGFVSLMFMQTFVLAGQIIGMQTSLGFASMVDPSNGQQVPIIGQFYLVLATLLFFVTDCHLAMFAMLLASFETLPIGESMFVQTDLREIGYFGAMMFLTALKLALAAIVALLLINFSFGIMTRAAPQLNIFAIGFPITMLSGLLILWFTIELVVPHFIRHWGEAERLLCDLVNLSCRIN